MFAGMNLFWTGLTRLSNNIRRVACERSSTYNQYQTPGKLIPDSSFLFSLVEKLVA